VKSAFYLQITFQKKNNKRCKKAKNIKDGL